MCTAIHSVFILKENILFLEEWIDYHILLGFDKFYLYDNSKVSLSGGCHVKSNHFNVGKVNKYGVDYDSIVNLTNEKLYEKLNLIKYKYKCVNIIEWSPKDKHGNILFNQSEAHNHCLKRMKEDNIEWCANIDMDEYIVINNYDNIKEYLNSINEKVSSIYLTQKRFDSRFNNLNSPVTSIDKMEINPLPLNHSNKIIYKVMNTNSMKIHSCDCKGEKIMPTLDNNIWFNHYKLNIKEFKTTNVISNKIREAIKDNYYNNYIKII